MQRLIPVLALIMLVGMGCGTAKAPVTATSTAVTPTAGGDPLVGQEPLDMPGVPYGTYKRSLDDIEKAKQAEQNWQQHTQQ